jgi:predicted O-methyltransferase YrrM
LWLPERLLARSDPTSTTFLPTMLFTIHARVIQQQLLDDLRTGHTAPYPAAWLAAFDHNLERVLDAAALPENHPWPTIGFNSDYLIYRDSVFDPFFGRGRERETAAFCDRYYWRTWLHRPRAMLGEVAAELAVVYDPKHPVKWRRLFNVMSLRGERIRRPLSYDYTSSLACAQNAGVHARLVTSRYGQRYLRRLGALSHTEKTVWQFPLVVYLNDWLNKLRVPLLVLALVAGIALLGRPGARTLVGAVWLCLLVDFSLYLTVAVVHTLDIERYVQNQHACSVLGAFAAVLLPWQWLRRKAKGPPPPASSSSTSMSSCIALTQTLVECRYLPVYAQLNTIGQKHSMLHLDVLTLLYYFARHVEGDILEIGPYLGGSTIAMGLGIKESGRGVQLTTIEGGGSLATHPTLPSDDILRDLKRNLAKRGVAELVTLIEGRSDRPAVMRQVRDLHAPGSVGLFVIDADGLVERDLAAYESLLREDCLLVIDDYHAPGSGKAEPTRAGVDALVAAGRAETLGLYGWGTWIGRRVPRH